ncbi:MAG TPA: hypothetical protein P5150_09330 [Candidatus Ratteibacteria bacterium]|nr:hypothetical protein [Candidatus Ratteibacteria bacterium]
MKRVFIVFMLTFSLLLTGSSSNSPEKKIQSYIKKLASAPDYETLGSIASKIFFEFELQALPFLVEGIKNENIKIKCGSYIALDEIIFKEVREPLGIYKVPFKELDFNLVPEDIRDTLKEIYAIITSSG